MATKTPVMVDILDVECRELLSWEETLEALYNSSEATEIAIEHLMIPIDLDFKSVVAEMQSMKHNLDRQMQLIQLLSSNVQQLSMKLRALKDADDRNMVKEYAVMRKQLVCFCTQLRSLIKQCATYNKAFHVSCKLILDFIIELYCHAID